jgi:ATP-binding cassette subfamily B protein
VESRAALLLEQFGFSRVLLIFAALVALCAVLAGIFDYLSRISMAKGAERIIRRLRDHLFAHTQALPFEWHTKNKTGDIIQRCTSDVETARRFVLQQMVDMLRTFMLVSVAIIIMFTIDVRMALIVAAFMPIMVSYSLYFFRKIGKKFLECDEAEGEVMIRVQENLTGVRVVRAFGRERHEVDRFNEQNLDYTNKWISLGGTMGAYWGVGDVVSYSQLLAVIGFGSYFAATGAISLGDMLVFISYTLTLMWPVRGLGRLLTDMSKTGVSLKRIKQILDAPAETADPKAERPPINRDIEFKNVTFSYGTSTDGSLDAAASSGSSHGVTNDTASGVSSGNSACNLSGGAPDAPPVLKNISFRIERGTTFGILGATGSGKTTLTYLLNRLYDLPEGCGEITIGGVNINRIDKPHLRKNVGLVLQEPFLFSKTLFENLDIAARSGNLAKVREKAAIAALDENIMSFTNGYDTIVGERGMTLSGGQKQRVAIARTLMMEAPIMIFDDSMSALDMETDAKIREALKTGTSGATVILISHRISTLMTADTIMVMDNGEIEEIGSHEELMAKNGHYRRVYELQSGDGD